LLLMLGLSSSSDPTLLAEVRALATQIANAHKGQPIKDASGNDISPNLQAAIMAGFRSQNPQLIAQSFQTLFTVTGGTDTALSSLFPQAASNMANFYVQANTEINDPNADPTDVTNVQLALTGALTTSSTPGVAQTSLTIDQRTDE